jgi:hypothetical protein
MERRITQSAKRKTREQAYSVPYTNRHPWGIFPSSKALPRNALQLSSMR